MTTQQIKPCKFIEGICINCNAKVRGKCGGWIEPSGEVQMLKHYKVENDKLLAERDALRVAGKLALEALEHVQWKNWRTDKAITELLRAGVE